MTLIRQPFYTLRWLYVMRELIALGLLLFVVLSIIYWYYKPKVTRWLRRLIAGRSYKRNAKQGLLTIPLRIEDHGVFKQDDMRRFDKFRERWFGGINESYPLAMGKSIGVMGPPGQGKTELLKNILYTLRSHPSPIPTIVFDTKGEYEQLLCKTDLFPDVEVVKLSVEDSTHRHNLLAEAARPSEFREIIKLMFGQPDGKYESKGNPFFSDTAIQLLESLLRCYVDMTDFSKDRNERTTWGFLDFVRRYDPDTLAKIVEQHDDPAIARASEYINPKSERQQVGVYATLLKNINNAFVDDFRGDPDDAPEDLMSVREFFHDPQDRVLIISRPAKAAESVDMIYRFLLDWAMKLSLSDEYPAVFLYDEFPAVPALRYIDELASQGRAKNAMGIFGIQDVNQLYNKYGNEGGRAVLSSMVQQVFLGGNSEEMSQYASLQLGTELVEREGQKQTTEGATIHGTWDVNERILKPSVFDDWDAGRAAVKSKREDGKRWAYGRLAMLSKVRRKYDKAARYFPPITGAGERVAPPYLTEDEEHPLEGSETETKTETETETESVDNETASDESADPEPDAPEPPPDEPLFNASGYDVTMSDAERTLHTNRDGEDDDNET